jgi:FkbM family methyltransferase
MLKNTLKRLFQKILGFDNFLFLFSIITIKRLYMNKHEKEFVYFLSLLPPDGLVLDIGANIGIMTVPLAKKADRGLVYAFEPMPGNLTALKRVIKHYHLTNVTLFEHALGNQTAELKMLMPVVGNVKMQGLCRIIDDDNTEPGERFTVPVIRLDDIAQLQNAKNIAGIKIDVENFEFEALSGAKNLLLKHKPIIYCEIWDTEKRALTLNFLQNEIGYAVKVYDGEKLVPYMNQDVINFFMMP